MTTLDTRRHDELFNKSMFAMPIHLIGVGGVGSHVALELAKLGVGSHPSNVLDFYDGDIIEPHNVANQAYGLSDIGSYKVDALKQNFASWSGGQTATAHKEFVTGRTPLSGVVFLCLDSMQARKDICESSIWRNPDVKLVIETRMDADNAIVFALDPCNDEHVAIWDEYWFPDEEAVNQAGCGGHLSVITAVAITASIAVQQFVTFAKTSDLSYMANHVRLTLSTWECKATAW